MSIKEVYEGLEKDAKKVQVRIDKICPKAIREFRKKRAFPTWYIDSYTIPKTNNQYVIFIYAATPGEVDNPRYSSFCLFNINDKKRCIIKGKEMNYRHTQNRDFIKLPQIHLYTNHFFTRYNERFLHMKNLSQYEIAGLFFVRNHNLIPIKLNEEINRNYKEYGDHNDYGMRVQDGFCFTQTTLDGIGDESGDREKEIIESMLLVYTTFINEKAMDESQRAAIYKEHVDVWKKCMDLFSNHV